MSDSVYKRIKVVEICLFFCACFIAASRIDISHAPDEAMRYPIAQFIFANGSLPNGMEDSLVNHIWGFSYALYPYLTSIISAFFMKIVSAFASSDVSLLIAARMTSVAAGTGTIILCFKIGEQLFKSRPFSVLLATSVCFLPQFVFLCSYQNNDSFAVFSGALIIYFWILALKTDWALRACIGVGVGCGLCAMSYYNAYVFLLATLVLYFVSRILNKDTSVQITGGALIIFLIAFAIAGWFFIRNATLHNGDFLGFNTTTLSAERYAMDGYRPSQLQTPKSLGMSFSETFFKSDWIPTVAASFIGVFSYMTVKLPLFLYALYFLFFLIGFVGFVTRLFGRQNCKASIPLVMKAAFIMIILVNLGLFMYSAYTKDYQAQGRYMMPSLLPLMIIITEGFRILSWRFTMKVSDPTMNRADRLADIKRRDVIFCAACSCFYLVLFFISYLGFLLPGCTI